MFIKGLSIVLTVATILFGTSGQALAASPEILLKSTAAPAPEEMKLPEGAAQIVAALEELEPELKTLTVRTVKLGTGNEIVLYMSHPKDEYVGASLAFDRETGEMLDYSATLDIWNSKGRVTDEVLLQRAEKLFLAVQWSDKRKMTGAPKLSQIKEKRPEIVRFRYIEYPAMLNGLEVDRGIVTGIYMVTDYEGHLLTLSFQPLDLEDTKVPDPKSALAPEAVAEQLFTPDHFDYGYVQEGNDGKPSIQYAWRTSPFLDAVTGKQIEAPSGLEIVDDGKRNPVHVKNITINPQANSLIVSNRADAEKIVTNLFGTDKKLTNMPYDARNTWGDFVYSWEDHGGLDIRLTVDESTGQVINAMDWTRKENLSSPLTREEALKKAITVLESYAPISANEWQVEIFDPYKPAVLADWMMELYKVKERHTDNYSFRFHRLQNGLPVLDHNYWVVIEMKSGQVVYFFPTMPNKEGGLPVLKPSVTAQQAADLAAKNLPLKLSYFWPTYNGKKSPYLQLVYTIDTYKGWPTVDAVSGKFEWSNNLKEVRRP
ncbi:YcdB/YcdC domain-containing protein [Brevibacillus porteri]|uniref:YcdB/YcdC repeated domain-containing protein n=1 Tax=Brevibacillus porteri TaxID=2126350 RepID=A0ABX5FJR2_9BACL|nr:YcdB/YcdC domain-containing protein [Brevibacillus porteri]MED1800803.1 hypothetical protein [Brevibacillus porteri]MED2132597.1 hypothetical protein [Brevibacillus porteri]MED2747691.1 hypothetical protein [Brevibacillus porteri]MED2818223.1 hypothetical protein [Brevibacillus porteri]MED2894677.1 hypothetical protein [Brevibacillus porteri]